jgi:hypothetical protein
MRSGNTRYQKERALSEVIGFVLILGIITAAFSLYLVYGVPAQGRENEINHMNDIKDQFVSYKIGLDALWVNHQMGTTVSNAFTLGTGGGYTQGSNSIIPIFSPVSSSGVIGINERGAENLTITSQSLIINSISKNTTVITVSQSVSVSSVPQHIYLNITGISLSDLTKNSVFGAQLQGVDSGGKTWIAQLNLTPRITSYQNYTLVTPTGTSGTYQLNSNYVTNYTGSDLTLTITKAGTIPLQDYIIYKNVAPGSYSIDLMDDAYGLGKYIGSSAYPMTINVTKSQSPLNDITASGLAVFGYNETLYTCTIPMGSLEYRAQNPYWISQTYYYQLGGVFLYQPTENGTTPKLPPEISFTYVNSTVTTQKIVTVNINALTIDQSSSGLVGGNSPVQIKTALTNQSSLPYVQGLSGNSRWINIAVTTTDPAAQAMWRNYFITTALAAGIPNYTTGISGNDTFIRIDGYDTTSGSFDVNVVAQNATYAVNVQGIGGTLQ